MPVPKGARSEEQNVTMLIKHWRERLIYAAASAFLAWHTLALVIAPAPSSSLLIGTLRELMQPYLTLLRLDNAWDFFAPTVPPGSKFQYIVENADGVSHEYSPSDELSWFHPSWYWFRSWYTAIIDDPDTYADAAISYFCRKHADLRPVSVILLDYRETGFTRQDYLAGKRPADPEFYVIHTVKQGECQSS
jgi:hypothetical protein